MMQDTRWLRWIKDQARDYLMTRRNVVACGVGYKETAGERTDEPCVVISVERKLPEAELHPDDVVPRELAGAKTDVQESGVIHALGADKDHTDRWRPAPGGVSIGHMDITAGTLGCLVEREGELFILSNNHVLSNSNAGKRGDPILQPGHYDGGTIEDQVAVLEDYVPINFGDELPSCPVTDALAQSFNWLARLVGSSHRMSAFKLNPAVNLVDAAIARPTDGAVEKRILEIGVPAGWRKANLGMAVQKSGRTTALTTGKIVQTDVTCRVNYGRGKVALFEDQLAAGPISEGGDSGSVVLDDEGCVVGLLFAGSDSITLMNPVHLVQEALDVEVAIE